MIERRPRAPVLRSMALRAMAPSASSASVRSIDSISNSRWYCFTSAFLGWVKMSLREGSSRSSSVATTGSRPTNSGIRPYFKRSSRQTERVFLVHRRDIIDPVEIGQGLQISLVLDHLLGTSVQQADMRV